MTAPRSPLAPLGSVEIIGHRGYAARFPENTLPSLEGALRAGAHSLEWDVHFTRCGTPVLFHDDTLNRTTNGRGKLAARRWEELRELDAGGWKDPEFAGTPIPTLAEALDLAEERVHTVFCEVKGVNAPGDLDTLLHVIGAAPAPHRVVVISLEFDLLRELRRRHPSIPLGWVVGSEKEVEGAAREVTEDGHALLDPRASILLANPERTRRWVDEGVPLATWTVNDPDEAQELVALGVRRLTTDEVGVMVGRWS